MFCSCLCTVCSKVSDSLMLCPFCLALCLPCTLFFVSCLCQQSSLTSLWRSFTGLVQLIFSFPSWFHTIWFYCSHTFHSFLSQNTLCFSFGSKDVITAFTRLPSYRYSSFTLRAWPLPMWSRFICMRVFRRVKKWLTYHVAVPTGNALASQPSIFRVNRLTFSTFICRWETVFSLGLFSMVHTTRFVWCTTWLVAGNPFAPLGLNSNYSATRLISNWPKPYSAFTRTT